MCLYTCVDSVKAEYVSAKDGIRHCMADWKSMVKLKEVLARIRDVLWRFPRLARGLLSCLLD
jgi:hypothetical protein